MIAAFLLAATIVGLALWFAHLQTRPRCPRSSGCSFRGFNSFEFGTSEGFQDSELSYLPTRARLEDADGGDWY